MHLIPICDAKCHISLSSWSDWVKQWWSNNASPSGINYAIPGSVPDEGTTPCFVPIASHYLYGACGVSWNFPHDALWVTLTRSISTLVLVLGTRQEINIKIGGVWWEKVDYIKKYLAKPGWFSINYNHVTFSQHAGHHGSFWEQMMAWRCYPWSCIAQYSIHWF